MADAANDANNKADDDDVDADAEDQCFTLSD